MAGALIGALRVSLSAETTAFEAGMNRSQAIAKRTAANMNTAFSGTTRTLERTALRFAEVLTLAAIVRAGKAALEYAGHLGELADTLGLTTKDLQTFSYAAGQVGISQDELEAGIQKLTISMGKAQLGSKAQAQAFKAIGISIDDLKGKDAGDVFRMIAERLEKVTDRSQRAAVEVALFGKAGAKLDNLLSGSQGRLNELSDAAERLGIVLSDEQIRKADETADKIAALQTVLKARIAGAVADNANAILALANAVATLIGTIGPAISGLGRLWAELKAGAPFLAQGIGGIPFYAQAANMADDEARRKAALQKLPGWFDPLGRTVPTPRTGGDINPFLGGGGGKDKKQKDDHTAERLARQAYEYQRDDLNAQKEILEAKKDLSNDISEQASLQLSILDLERQQYRADLDYQVKQNELSKGQDGITRAQADHMLAQFDIADSLKHQAVLNERNEDLLRQSIDLDTHGYDLMKDHLQLQEDLATTMSERRAIELQILELAYREKRIMLDRIINESKKADDVDKARQDRAALDRNHSLERQGVINATRGPLEEWAASVPKTAAEINEALQTIEAQGLDGLVDAISSVIDGTKSLKDAFGDLAKSIISDIIKMTLKMLIFRAVSSIFGSAFGGGTSGGVGGIDLSGYTSLSSSYVPRFATGGSFSVIGRRGVDKNLLSLNGLPIARVSHGERISVANDATGSGGTTVNQYISPNFQGNAATQEDLVRMAAITKAATMDALRDQRRRA